MMAPTGNTIKVRNFMYIKRECNLVKVKGQMGRGGGINAIKALKGN